MEHLKRAHQAKEADIEHTKKLYEEQQQRRWRQEEEEQQQQQQANALMGEDLPDKDLGSDTSSVSGSTALGTSTGISELNEEEDGSTSSGSTSSVDDSRHRGNYLSRNRNKQEQRKRKRATSRVNAGGGGGGGRRHAEDDDNVQAEQLRESLLKEEACQSVRVAVQGEHTPEQGKGRGVRRMLSEKDNQNNMSSTETSSISEEENEDTPLGGKDISFHKDSSTLSDMTDSNQSGTDGGSGGEAKSRSKGGGGGGGGGGEGDISTSSISSTAAVVLGLESSQNAELVWRRRRHAKSKYNNLSSIKEESNNNSTGINAEKEQQAAAGTTINPSTTIHKKKRRSFHYDYKEVFLKSNVPQLIATLSGRIVVCK